ncbi:hypothetical protein XMD420_000954 [Marinobacterium sp. xm-d-420]|uniref:hypothetical protein n=1 Tax=Marinobacterium sp. xm-d-420 TaxID=2497737 RepID=UPI0015695E4D|nr:hypothetical protein [Marinobacterium sp. xm-d-420]NRP27351.1 hypothetical protein [Marinobacterium sp. xm-d-420]
MSTSYCAVIKLPIEQVFDKRLWRHGIIEFFEEEITTLDRCLTNGIDYIWIHLNKINETSCAFQVDRIPTDFELQLIELLEANVYSEHEPQFWGFETMEEWHSAMEEEARIEREEFYANLVAFLKFKTHKFKKGTVAMDKVLIAHDLVIEDPTFLVAERKDQFLETIDKIYYEEQREKHQEVPW